MADNLLHIDGKPYVVLPLHEYLELKGQSPAGLPQEIINRISSGRDNPIRVLRKHLGMTQEELAKATGLSRTYLTEIETGRKDGSLRALKAIAGALEVDLAFLTAKN